MDTRDVVASSQQRQPSGVGSAARESRPDPVVDAASDAYGQVIRFIDWLFRIFP